MRILYIHYKEPNYRPGGMAVHIQFSTAALRALGHEVEVLPMLESDARAQLAGRERQRSALRKAIARFVFQPRALARLPARARKVWRAVKASAPDVLVVRYSPFEWSELMIARLLRLPIVFEVNATSFELRQWKSSEVFVYPLTTPLERSILNRAGGVLVISEGMKQLLVGQGILRELITVNPNGADPDRFSPAVCGAAVRKRLGLTGELVVGFLGSFARWHDLHTIFAILPQLARDNPQVDFLFAGGSLADVDPGQRAGAEALGSRVAFTGPFDPADAPQYLAAMDIALSLFPKIEPFNASVIKQFEYMAAGRAIVATAIGQQAEILRDGVSALLVPPEDVEAVRRAVQALIDNPEIRARLGAEARRCLVANYTWARNAERIAVVCERAIGVRRGGDPSLAVGDSANT